MGPVVALPEPSTQKGNSHADSDESMGITKRAQSIEVHQAFSVGALREVDLLADASDVLDLSPTRQGAADGDYFAAFQDDLPADPMEGLAIPSWYELLDEATCQLTPQGFPWTAPALTESPASKRQKSEGVDMMLESGRQPDWTLNQELAQISPDRAQHGMPPYGGEAFKMPERMSVQASQSSKLVPAAHGSDTLTQDRNRSHSVETSSAGEAGQQGQREGYPAAVQTAQGGKAKRAKRGAAGRKAPGSKHTMAASQGKEAGQGQTEPGQLGKQCTASLGKVLPFDTLKVRCTLCALFALHVRGMGEGWLPVQQPDSRFQIPDQLYCTAQMMVTSEPLLTLEHYVISALTCVPVDRCMIVAHPVSNFVLVGVQSPVMHEYLWPENQAVKIVVNTLSKLIWQLSRRIKCSGLVLQLLNAFLCLLWCAHVPMIHNLPATCWVFETSPDIHDMSPSLSSVVFLVNFGFTVEYSDCCCCCCC